MALIVRDEAEVIGRCLASFVDHIDVVAIVDTGSRDGTVEVVRRFFAGRSRPELRLGVFEWLDDFAGARNAADALLGDCDWLSWIDADDVLEGADQLRVLVAEAPPWIVGYFARYDYGRDASGLHGAQGLRIYVWRERLVRAGFGRWRGRVHETQDIGGPMLAVEPERLEWRHRKTGAAVAASIERNLRILEAWVVDEPHNPTVLRYLAREELISDRPVRALRWLARYVRENPPWDRERAHAYRELAVALVAVGRADLALRAGREAVRRLPDDPLGHLTVAELTGTPSAARGP